MLNIKVFMLKSILNVKLERILNVKLERILNVIKSNKK